MCKINKKAFTLVELIVVITILAILGTIAFLAFQGYSASARDSKRISDLNTIKTSLELFGLNSGKFPDPVNPVSINYSSGSINNLNLRQQGIFGQQNITNISSAGKLDRLPKDPLTELEYTYSVTFNKKEFELGTILEKNEVAFSPVNNTNAASKKVVTAFIKGNYNGKILKTSSGSTSYIFGVPSIINSDASLTNIIDLINQHKLVYNGFANLPASYDGPTFEVNGAPNSNFVNATEILVFEGDIGTLILPDNSTPRIQLLEAIKNAYSGTELTSVGGIREIVESDPSNPTTTEENLAGIIVNSEFGGNVKIIPNSGSGTIVDGECPGNTGYGYGYGYGYGVSDPHFDLCSNIKLDSISNIPTSSALTNNIGSREVYAFILEGGKTYNIETLGNDANDTVIYLYDKDGNMLIMNDDLGGGITRSKVQYTTTYTGYYYLGVMGFDDQGTSYDYTLSISL